MSRKITSETGQSQLFDISVKIADKMKEEKGLIANVDFYSATVYHSMNIEHDLFTPILQLVELQVGLHIFLNNIEIIELCVQEHNILVKLIELMNQLKKDNHELT